MIPRWFILLLLAAATVLAHLPVLGNGFVIQDDPEWIFQNPLLNPPSLQHLRQIWTEPTHGLYVPLMHTVWSIAMLISPRPAMFHGLSLLLHVLSVWLVFLILRRLVAAEGAAVVGALLFALHPLQVESVAWASGAKDVLGGMLSLVVIHQYLAHLDAAEDVRRRRWHYAAAMAALAMAMLAKPSAVVAPAIAGLIDLLLIRKSLRAAGWSLWPMMLLIVPCILWSRQVQTQFEQLDVPLILRPLVATDAIAFYLYKLVWPVSLANIYGRTPGAAEYHGWLFTTWIVPVLLGAVLWIYRRRAPWAVAGAGAFVIALSPVLGLTQFMFQLYSTVADHYMYLPMFGIALIAAGAVAHQPRPTVYALAGAVLLALAVRTSIQARYWRDSVTLFARTVQLHPENIQARVGLGKALALAGRAEEATPHFQMVVDSQPLNPHGQALLAQALAESGRLEQAAVHYGIAAQLSPQDPYFASQLRAVRERLATRPTTQ